MGVRSLSWDDPLEKGMAAHSSILAWRIPMDRGAWQAIVYGVTKSRTQLKRLSVHTRLSHDAGQRQPPLRFDIPTLTTDLFFAFRTVFNQLCEIVSTLL